MHGSFDRFQENRNRTDRDWNAALFALPVAIVVAIALIALAIVQPAAPSWISEAAQAEFVGMNLPDIVPTQQVKQIRNVKAD